MACSIAGRSGAAMVALCAWVGVGLYFAAEKSIPGTGWLGALWINLGYLTDLTNMLLAIVMTGVALGVRRLSRPAVIGWAVSAILFVGIGFWVIGGRLTLGESALEDILLHGVTPWLSLLVWLLLMPKGWLRLALILPWLGWPIGYFGYALVRGAQVLN